MLKAVPSVGAVVMAVAAAVVDVRAGPAGDDLVEHGRYLVQTAGCNDCHTPGYAESEGRAIGPAGGPAPAYLPPGSQPSGPVIRFPH